MGTRGEEMADSGAVANRVLHQSGVAGQARGVETQLRETFVPVIEIAITPVILLSGVGALMITLTNRMGRVVDRTRALAGQMCTAAEQDRPHVQSQLGILWRRAKLVRLAVTFAGLSMLLSCALVMAIFIDATRNRYGLELVVLFVASIVCLILSLLAFLRDIWMSLWALQLEVQRAGGRDSGGPVGRS